MTVNVGDLMPLLATPCAGMIHSWRTSSRLWMTANTQSPSPRSSLSQMSLSFNSLPTGTIKAARSAASSAAAEVAEIFR